MPYLWAKLKDLVVGNHHAFTDSIVIHDEQQEMTANFIFKIKISLNKFFLLHNLLRVEFFSVNFVNRDTVEQSKYRLNWAINRVWESCYFNPVNFVEWITLVWPDTRPICFDEIYSAVAVLHLYLTLSLVLRMMFSAIFKIVYYPCCWCI